MAIRCVRLWAGSEGDSLFEEGHLELGEGLHGKASGLPIAVTELSFQETTAGAPSPGTRTRSPNSSSPSPAPWNSR